MKLLMDHAQASDVPLAQATDLADRALDEQFHFVIVMLVKDMALKKVRTAQKDEARRLGDYSAMSLSRGELADSKPCCRAS